MNISIFACNTLRFEIMKKIENIHFKSIIWASNVLFYVEYKMYMKAEHLKSI